MIDLAIILVFVNYSVANGFLNRVRASKSLEEYFLAGRTIKGRRAGFSMAATQCGHIRYRPMNNLEIRDSLGGSDRIFHSKE